MSEILSTFFITSSSKAVLKSFNKRNSSRWLAPKLYKVRMTESRNLVLKLKKEQDCKDFQTLKAAQRLEETKIELHCTLTVCIPTKTS